MTEHLGFIDCSLRDGQQSNWATRMTNAMVLPELERLDIMGFDSIDLIGGAVFDVCVRFLQEDPYERMRIAARRAPRTPLNVWLRGQSLYTFELYPDDIVELNARRIAANGIRRLTVYDALNDIRNIELTLRVAREVGLHASAQVVYTVSPAHTDDYYTDLARKIAALGTADTIGLKDPSGLLTPERIRTLVPAIKAAIGSVPLELHTHCRSGLGEEVVMESVPLGVTVLHTGIYPLGGGDANPDMRHCARQLKAAGYRVEPRDEDLAEMERRFVAMAKIHNKPLPSRNRYDPYLYYHQVPGGMISNLRSQLHGMGIEHRLQEVLEEAGRVRQDLGYPILVSPFAQFVITQATLNVLQGERYATIPDEVARYTLGFYGRAAAPIDEAVMDRVTEFTGIKDRNDLRPGSLIEPRVEKLQRTRGPFESDEDLLLAAFYQPSQLKPLFAMRGRGATTPLAKSSLRQIICAAQQLPRGGRTRVKRPGYELEGRR